MPGQQGQQPPASQQSRSAASSAQAIATKRRKITQEQKKNLLQGLTISDEGINLILTDQVKDRQLQDSARTTRLAQLRNALQKKALQQKREKEQAQKTKKAQGQRAAQAAQQQQNKNEVKRYIQRFYGFGRGIPFSSSLPQHLKIFLSSYDKLRGEVSLDNLNSLLRNNPYGKDQLLKKIKVIKITANDITKPQGEKGWFGEKSPPLRKDMYTYFVKLLLVVRNVYSELGDFTKFKINGLTFDNIVDQIFDFFVGEQNLLFQRTFQNRGDLSFAKKTLKQKRKDFGSAIQNFVSDKSTAITKKQFKSEIDKFFKSVNEDIVKKLQINQQQQQSKQRRA